MFEIVCKPFSCNFLIGSAIPVTKCYSSIFGDRIDHRLVGPVTDGDSEVVLCGSTLGHDVIRNIRNGKEQFGLRLFRLGHFYVILGNLRFEGTSLRLGSLSLISFTLRHKRTDGFRDFVHLGSRSILELLGGFALCIQTKHLVDSLGSSGEMFLLQARNHTSFIVINLF